MLGQWDEEEEGLQHSSSQGSHRICFSPDTRVLPILSLYPSTAGSKHTLLHPSTSTVRVPMPPTPIVVQRPRAELVCT